MAAPASAPAAAASSEPAPHRLPVPLTSFVGRRRELAEVTAALEATRILTIAGSGGSGKTRLALEAARAARGRHPGGTWWVSLASLADPSLVGAAIARAVDARPPPGRTELDAVAGLLADRRALLVLDNCEHLLDACAFAVESLAGRCTGLTVLATSRAPLRIGGETAWTVPPLSLPSGPGEEAQGLAASDAARLFAERAAGVRPGFTLADGNAAAVARIVRELDGMPLAIELAAARLRFLSPDQVADGLSDRFRLLARGMRTALPRHRTLRASVDWSHDLLPDAERLAFRRLGVFAGSFAPETAARVCAGSSLDAADVLDLVGSLVEHSLLRAEEGPGGMRYAMLRTVREYALERLEAAGEAERLRAAHRDAHLELAEDLAPRLLTPDQAAVLERFDAAAADLAEAIRHAAATDPGTALRLCGALTSWWRLRGLFAYAARALSQALGAAGSGPSSLRAEAVWARAYLAVFAGDFAAAADAADGALAEARAVRDRRLEGRALMVLGKCSLMRDPPAASRPLLRRALALATETGDDLCRMHAAQALGFGHVFRDEHDQARRCFEEVLPLVERTGHHEFLANHWAAAGWAAYVAGRLRAAREPLERGVVAARAVGDTVTEAGVTAYVAAVLTASGAPEAALERLVPVHGRALAQGAGFLLPFAEVAIAEAHAAAGRPEEARAAFEALLAGPAGAVGYAATWALAAQSEALRLLGAHEPARNAASSALKAARRLGTPWLAARAELTLGRLAAAAGRWDEAERRQHEALGAIVRHGHRLGLPDALEALAGTAAGCGDPGHAARILGAADRLRDRTGITAWPHARAERDRLAGRLRAALGEEAYGHRMAEGAALGTHEVVAWLRRARGPRRRPQRGWESLTPTELEVVRHAAAGLSNPEIGRRMFIARSTVKAHLAHVYAKLGVRNRAELARLAAEHARTA